MPKLPVLRAREIIKALKKLAGTLRGILEDANISEDEFLKAL